jgi:hypothetical protein
MKLEIKLSNEELITRIKKHSRQQVIPIRKIMISKKQKKKNDRRSWKKDLLSKEAIPLYNI